MTLVNTSAGASIGSLPASTITVQASDRPYGWFVFSSTYHPFVVEMESGRIEVVVTREFGSLGQVAVDIQVLPNADANIANMLVNTGPSSGAAMTDR